MPTFEAARQRQTKLGGMVLKNSLTHVQTAIFESGQSSERLFIALLDNSTNQSFVVYRPDDFFNTIGTTSPSASTTAKDRFPAN